jgi:AraC-like DNA-binding protein/quercetin dioxygenase-like cupin family protein
MEKIYEGKVMYTPEHLTCQNYLTNIDHGFRYREYAAGSEVARESARTNVLMFVVSGELEANVLLFPAKHIHAGEMFLIPLNAFFNYKAVTDTVAIALLFDKWEFTCEKAPLTDLSDYAEAKQPGIYVERIVEPLDEFLGLLTTYLRNGVNCLQLHRMKINELFLLLRHFYTKESLAALFYPIIGDKMDFRMMCIRNVDKVKNINEMVALSGMSRTSFYNCFRAEFGNISPKEWLNNYLKQRILIAATAHDISTKTLMYSVGFSSESNFTQYCKRYFGMPPSDIIKQRASIANEV